MTTIRERDANSVWLIVVLAVATGMLRLSIIFANTLVLWHVYGRSRVLREHLAITSLKPELVVSNGEVLRGQTFPHFATGAAIWLVTTFLVALSLYRFVLPADVQRTLKYARSNVPGGMAIVWGFGLCILVAAVLPLSAALTLAAVSALLALSWAWRGGSAVGRGRYGGSEQS